MRRSSRSARAARQLFAWGLLAALGACSFLSDEFGWYALDRGAPAPAPAGAATDRP